MLRGGTISLERFLKLRDLGESSNIWDVYMLKQASNILYLVSIFIVSIVTMLSSCINIMSYLVISANDYIAHIDL